MREEAWAKRNQQRAQCNTAGCQFCQFQLKQLAEYPQKQKHEDDEELSTMSGNLSCSLNRFLLCAFALSAAAVSLGAQSPADKQPVVTDSPSDLLSPSATYDRQPLLNSLRYAKEQRQGVDWRHLIEHSLYFMSLENAFRCATEEGTRQGFSHAFFSGYLNSVGNLHGWNDGDPFLVNYVGHPMQGAVSGYLWTQNDRAFRDIQFGENRRYWKGKLRGAAYSYVYSVLFEIGPISEASIGNIQAYYPQQGFVDHVVTPVVGLGWSITEDALDQYFIRFLESRTSNHWARLLVRGGLNPARSMANVMALKPPWHRDNRPGVDSSQLRDVEFMDTLREHNAALTEVKPSPGVAPFEFNLTGKVQTYFGDRHAEPCVGGGGVGAFRLSSEWQFVIDVSGCKFLGLEKNLSGDSLSYLAGTRWTAQTSRRWLPHAELLIGGTKLTQELIYAEIKQILDAIAKQSGARKPLHAAYSEHWETNGFTTEVGSGLDVRLNSALSFRLANVAYSRSWTRELNSITYQNSLSFVSGLVLHMGTW